MRIRRGRGDERGQALVEFAIVAPLIVMILLFAIWFYELLFIRLKAQEAARYAAWEATAYKLHDYAKGKSELSKLASSMQTSVIADTMVRYSALNSSQPGLGSASTLGLQHTLLASSWAQPVVLVTNASEEQIPGGWIPNLLLSVAGNLFDWISALNYKDLNPVATSLVALGKDMGGAMTNRLFGNSDWGFNSHGYVEARVGILVKNEFFNRGLVGFLNNTLVSHHHQTFMVYEKHGVLADSWWLDDGSNVYGGDKSPGRTSTAYAKQIDRMYLVNDRTRGVAKGFATGVWAVGNAALGLVMSTASPDITLDDFTRASVVSLSFGDNTYKGQANIKQDGRPSDNVKYDTAPATKSQGSSDLQEFGKTLDARGVYFMGCDKEMSLGCPSATLSQENPFGSYVARQ
jgi:hypothetical protein